MKKFILYVMTALLLTSFMPTHLGAVTGPTRTSLPMDQPLAATRADTLLSRLNEIKAIEKSDLSVSEKKALRKEVRGIKSELKEQNRGVYLSVGAIVIIVLLLILLL